MTDPLGSQSGAGDAGQSAGGANQGTATATDAGAQSGASGTTGTTTTDGGQSTVTRAEFDQLRAQLSEADRKRAEAETQLRTLRDKDLPEAEKTKRDLAEAQAANEALQAEVSKLRVDNAFLTDNTHDWHNANDALVLLDRSRVTVDAQGKVVGVKEALDALAKERPHLLKPKPADGGNGTPPAPPPPGTAPANGGIAPAAGTKPSQEDLARRFPAFRQRLG